MQKFSFDFWEGMSKQCSVERFLPPTCERYLREGKRSTEWESVDVFHEIQNEGFSFGKGLVKGDNTGGTKCSKAEQR